MGGKFTGDNGSTVSNFIITKLLGFQLPKKADHFLPLQVMASCCDDGTRGDDVVLQSWQQQVGWFPKTCRMVWIDCQPWNATCVDGLWRLWMDGNGSSMVMFCLHFWWHQCMQSKKCRALIHTSNTNFFPTLMRGGSSLHNTISAIIGHISLWTLSLISISSTKIIHNNIHAISVAEATPRISSLQEFSV